MLAEKNMLRDLEAAEKALRAWIAYHRALTDAASEPGRMTVYRTVQGDDLDTLYDVAVTLAMQALGEMDPDWEAMLKARTES